MRKIALFLAGFLLAAAPLLAAGPDAILGTWTTAGGKSQVKIFKKGGSYGGRIIALKEPLYHDPKKGPVGTPKTDRNNPDPALHSRPILGLQILKGLTPTGNGRWGNGTIYDPESGNTYRCKASLAAPNRLKLRGYIGISLFGRTTVWTRKGAGKKGKKAPFPSKSPQG